MTALKTAGRPLFEQGLHIVLRRLFHAHEENVADLLAKTPYRDSRLRLLSGASSPDPLLL